MYHELMPVWSMFFLLHVMYFQLQRMLTIRHQFSCLE